MVSNSFTKPPLNNNVQHLCVFYNEMCSFSAKYIKIHLKKIENRALTGPKFQWRTYSIEGRVNGIAELAEGMTKSPTTAKSCLICCISNIGNNNNNDDAGIYSAAVIIAEPLREFTRFTQ